MFTLFLWKTRRGNRISWIKMTKLAIYIPRRIYRGRQSRARRFTSNVTQSGRNVASRIQGALARVRLRESISSCRTYVGVCRARTTAAVFIAGVAWKIYADANIQRAHGSRIFPLPRHAGQDLRRTFGDQHPVCLASRMKEHNPGKHRRRQGKASRAASRCELPQTFATIGWSLRKIATGAAALARLSFHSTPESFALMPHDDV